MNQAVNNVYKMISIDLDGTLLNSNKEISDYTKKVLVNLKKMGYILTISTGRSYVGIPDCIKKMNIIDYYITSNGASCVDKDKNYIIKEWINYELILELINYNFLFAEYLISGTWYIGKDSISNIKKIIKDDKIYNYIINTREVKDDIKRYISSQRFIEKVNLNFSDENYEYANKVILDYVKLNSNLRCWSDKKHKMDIYSNNATKGNTLKKLAEGLNISQNEIIGFGDDENDRELFEFVGHSVAMINGKDDIKNIVNEFTIYDNDNDGVAHFLDNLLLNN